MLLKDSQIFIEQVVRDNFVVLFMKGTPKFPRCGFSDKAVRLLEACGLVDFLAIDVLKDDGLRDGVKHYSRWPTIPQLYVKAQFIGGSDIMSEMYAVGELQELLGPFSSDKTGK